MVKSKVIINNVVWSTYLHRTELKNFQWNLKFQDNDKEIDELCKSIKKWFDAPLYIRYKHDNFILDWHQRLKALNKLADDWFLLEDDKVPVIYIKAETEKDAKRKVAEYNSKYSEVDSNHAKIFFDNVDLDWIIIKELIIEPVKEPDFKNKEVDEDDLYWWSETIICPKCQFEFIKDKPNEV